ncbi:MAG: DinB family protein [Blastocatellia bacterium]|nr:DinB family protein [Blastocatellia bacterium]
MKDWRNASLAETLVEYEAATADVRRLFGHLNGEQLNWKPSAEQWSIGQCLDHLIVANSGFFPQFEAVAAGRKTPSLLERVPGLPGFWAGMLIKILVPESTRKVKAPAASVPSSSEIPADIVARFAAHQSEMTARVRALESKDPGRVILTSPLAAFMTYSALDACRIGAVHERRHILQAERVMAAPGFPK